VARALRVPPRRGEGPVRSLFVDRQALEQLPSVLAAVVDPLQADEALAQHGRDRELDVRVSLHHGTGADPAPFELAQEARLLG